MVIWKYGNINFRDGKIVWNQMVLYYNDVDEIRPEPNITSPREELNEKYRIVIDACHGGVDPGAVSGNLKEKDFTLEAANYMYNRFKELGVPVVITRDTDKSLTRNERINLMKSLGTDSNVIVLSNHINAGGGEFSYVC